MDLLVEIYTYYICAWLLGAGSMRMVITRKGVGGDLATAPGQDIARPKEGMLTSVMGLLP